MFDAAQNLIASKKIPLLDSVQMSNLTRYLFTTAEGTIRFQVAEVVYRYDHEHSNAMDVFLACTLPLARKLADRKAVKILKRPSAWQLELMYDGAVAAAITLFQNNTVVRPEVDAFRRYLIRALVRGTLRSYFMRLENQGIRSVSDFANGDNHKRGPCHNASEQKVISHLLLSEVINFPHLREPLSATLQCIGALGPDGALKEHAYTASGDPDKWKRQRRARPILNPDAIAAAMGTTRADVHRNLREARLILRDVFNPDGKLFLNC
jgi:hypothetical protein